MSSSYYSGNNSNSIEAIVVDIGAGLTKMGWAGDDYPRSIFRSVSGDDTRSLMSFRYVFWESKLYSDHFYTQTYHNFLYYTCYYTRQLHLIAIPKLDGSKPMHSNMITSLVLY